MTTVATTTTNAGSYPITAAQGTLSATNYSFSFVNGTLTITNLNGIVAPAALQAFIGNGIVDQAGLNVVLANYWASSPPHISDFNISAKTNFTFIITNFNFNFTVQFSTNLVNPNWQDLGQAVFQFTDTNAAIRQTGFYRLIASTNALVPGDTNGDGIVDQAELNAVLAHYWASSPPYISNFASFGNTNFTFTITNFAFTVQFSTNLVNTNWQDLGQATFQFTDPNAVIGQQRYYRLVTP